MNLHTDETIELVVKKNKCLPLRNEDWLLIPQFLLLTFFLFIFPKFNSINNLKSIFANFILFFFFFYNAFFFFKNYYRRIIIAYKWTYLITNQRLILMNQHSEIEHSFYYGKFPEVYFSENAYKYGFIIIGKRDSILLRKIGKLNLIEREIALYNVDQVRDVYNLLISKIEHVSMSS